ncbi:MAG: F0F1 ATP synthase subunit delta [Gammaproteobacteria bacterium]|nr:F0F1 ATP synthase subunit delta [Gammaproteobacteria bacterium]MBU1440717.1 F0F1 ATP synthase subunit delta [Gammaproteobacteria bacterium]
MLIDWFTVGAQALNFVVLVWLMKRFLYGPVLGAIAAREKRIADQIADASAKDAQAGAERESFERRNADLDDRRDALMAQAVTDAKDRAAELIDDARKAADALVIARQQALDAQAIKLSRDIGIRARHEVFAVARRALSDLGTVNLESCIADVFVRRLRGLPESAKATLAAAIGSSEDPARVRSAFDLTDDQRECIRNALNEFFMADVPVRFEVGADLIGGIELRVGGQELAWSISTYLTSLEQAVAELMSPRTHAPEALHA